MGWESFKLHPKLITCLQKCNFITPSSVQERALIYTSFQLDLIIAAKTGSGKTLCYLIPVLNKLFFQAEKSIEGEKEDKISALILMPTRELAVQVHKIVEMVLEKCREEEKFRFRSVLISGGFSSEKQERLLKSSPDIMIATIGRLWDILENNVAVNESLKKIGDSDFLVLDEVDRILELGQFKELTNVLKFLENP